MGHAKHTGTNGFGVMELQFIFSEFGTWVDVATSTPYHILPLQNLGTWPCTLHANGSLFCLTLYNAYKNRDFRPLLVFDVARNSWYVLPLERCSTEFGCIFMHQPRLSACVSSPGEEV